MEKADLFFFFVLQKKAFDFSFCAFGASHCDTEVGFFKLMVSDFFVDNAKCFRIFCGDDDSAGIAVNAVAQGRGKSVLPLGFPFFLLV